MLLTTYKRSDKRGNARQLFLEQLEARNQPAVVAGAGLAVREFFSYTAPNFSGPTDFAFGKGGLFGSDLYFTDSTARRVYRLNDINFDHDATDAGEGSLLYQFPSGGVDRPVALLFGSNVDAWGDDLYLIDDGVDKVFRVSDDSGSLVISPLVNFPNVGPLPTPLGGVFSADGQFMLVNDCQRFTIAGGASDGRVYKISSTGSITLWATGANLPNGLWDNNSQAAMTSDGWFTTGQDAINPGGVSQIVQFRDNNGDGDAMDADEGRILVGSNVLGLNKKVFAFDSHDVLYVASTTAGGVSKVFRLEDLNHDGDYFDSTINAFDAGESTIVLDGLPGGISGLRVGPEGAIYVGVREGVRGVVYRLADGQPPAQPPTPDLDAGSDSGSSSVDNVTNVNTPTFTGTAEAGSNVKLYSNVAGLIGTTTADASGNWTITSITLGDGVHQISATATDAEGNVSNASAALQVTIDTVAPLISATLDRQAASTGWYNLSTGAPIATIYGSDAGGSGVAFVSDPFQFGEGRNLSAPGTVIDVAGNIVTRDIFLLNVDLTPPLISATLDRQAASTGWYNLSTGAPIATIYGSDEGGSGVAFVSSPYQFGEGQHLSAPGKVIDVAGNVVERNIFDLFVDLTPPLISATLDRQPASTGWYNLSTGAPIATIYGSDAGGSGVAFVSDPFQFGEGQHLSAPGKVIDVAGNVVERNIFDLFVDLTPPLISATLDRQPASTGWYNLSTGAPIATIYGSDAGGSGVAFVSDPFQFGEGQHLSAPGKVIDVAGNVVERNIFDLFVDLTPPLISATLDRQPASTGWYNVSTGAPIATIYGSDAGGSGVAFVSDPFQFGEGQHLSAPGTVIDVAGNVVTRNIFDLFVDLTPPSAPTITSPASGTVTTSTVLTITGTAEAGSRVEIFRNGSSLGTTLVNSLGQWSFTTQPLVAGDHLFSAAATDVAGNTGGRTPDVLVTVQNGTGPRVVPITISIGQVNLNGGGTLPVTILSSADFDVRTLKLATLRLNGSKPTSISLKDVNGDGRLDLVLQFRREDFVDEYTAAIKKDLADGRLDSAHQLITLTLTGKTKDGKDIVATAQVDMFMSGKKLQDLVAKFAPSSRKKR